MRLTSVFSLAFFLLPSFALAQGPVFVITPVTSTVLFNVKASVAIEGKFDKWDRHSDIPVYGCFVGRFGHKNSGCYCEHW